MTNIQMAKAFNEWMLRFIDEPEQFEREFETVSQFLKEQNEGNEPTYGETAAAYLNKVHTEISVQSA